MSAIVIYKSKTGFAKKYAEWIAEDICADIVEASKATIDMLTNYNVVIYGSGLYAVGINGVELIRQNLDKLKGKKVIVFATGASPAREEVITEVRNKNFTSEQQKNIRFYYLRGGFDYNKLNFLDKILMKLLKFKIERKKELTPDERGMLAAYNKPVDFTNKNNINEIVSYYQSVKYVNF